MTDQSIKAKRLNVDLERGKPVQMTVDGAPVTAYEGETIAAALMNAGYFVSRDIDSNPLGVYCNIGKCHSCVMTVNGEPSVRICQTLVSDGCKIESQHLRRG